MGDRHRSYDLPPRWLNCPRRSDLIASKFVAIKTPLDQNYNDKLEPKHFWTPSLALQSFKSANVNVGLWIDLTNTSRFYNKDIVESKGVRYVKIECRGHGERPSVEQTEIFMKICDKFFSTEPAKKILVHCTHGFNRSGFLICAYLVERHDWSIEACVKEFAEHRAPGIYKQDYLQELFQRYGDVRDTPEAPKLPWWCFAEEDGDDEPQSPQNGHGNGKSPMKPFMEGVPNVFPAERGLWPGIQRRVSDMCKWNGRGFPGSQPVSLDWNNIQLLRHKPYLVSWKADGTRYMMLIDGPDRIFFIDRDNSIFHAKGVRFPRRKNPDGHLENTLLDGEMIIDEHEGIKTPRYLIYDIVKFEGQDVGGTIFSTRRLCITREIIAPRDDAKRAGTIDRTREPFGIRIKDFWDIKQTKAIFGPRFSAALSHEIDGLIFQPHNDPYKPGQCPESLKWKPETHNSIDFRARIVTESAPGHLTKKVIHLFVLRSDKPFSSMNYTKGMSEYDGKIIECTWDYQKNSWKFMRQRTDKSFPNSYDTACSVWQTIVNPISKEKLLDFIEHIPPHKDHHHQQQQQPQQQQHQPGRKRPYPSSSSDDRNLMPPPGVSRDVKRSKIS